MNKFCTQCGAELDENGLCPNCSVDTKAAPHKEAAAGPETAPEASPEKAPKAEQGEPAPAPEKAPAEPEKAPENEKEEPNALAMTITKACDFIAHFFSKKTVDTTLAQQDQKYPVWAVLLPLYAIVEAFSRTISFRASDGSSLGLSRIYYDMGMNSIEVFFFALALAILVCLAYSIALRVYLKILKVDTTFKEAANLTMAAYMPNAIVMLANIVLFGNLLSGQSTVSTFGMGGFVILLFVGVCKMLGDRKPFWSFFLMLLCATLLAAGLGIILYSPVIITRGLATLSGAFAFS